MKFSTVATIVSLSVGLTVAQPHGHSHEHIHKRAPAAKNGVAVVYELNGVPVSEHEVQEGIKNGTLVLADGGAIAKSHSHEAAHQAADNAHKAAHKAANGIAKAANKAAKGPTDVINSVDNSAHKHHGHKHHKAPKLPSSGLSSSFHGDSAGVDVDFPDGTIDCSDFPSEFGALKVDYLNLGGWAGVQQPGMSGGLFDAITTVVENMCMDGDCCKEGDFCSYACPAGYQKSQWPTTQGATGQSVGGLQCKGGKLHLTNPSLSKKLCMKGTDKVKVAVKNTMSELASVCRTDYPGTEGQTVPLSSTPGSVQALTCPDADNYYNWQGASTSAQYYLNPKGIDVSKACQWGSAANPWGNFAPLNLGVGYSNGAAWLSIFQNSPTTDAKLDYNVEIVGDNGGFDNMIGRCKYINGQFCSGDDYSDCSSTTGCTVNVGTGSATYVFSASS